MRIALFVNFSNEAFIGVWGGKPEKFAPNGQKGDRKHMEEWKARHYAKHLVNRELIKEGMENDTSPKFPEQHPAFMERFNKAVIIEDETELTEDELASAAIDAGYHARQSKVQKAAEEFNNELNPFKNAPAQEIQVQDDDKPASKESNFEGLKE